MWRKQEEYVEKWFKSDRRKPLVIRGARQVGKSTLVRNFARNNNLVLHEINVEQHLQLASVFSSKNVEAILEELEFLGDAGPLNKKSLVFIDEIQAIPEAIAALRYLYEERPDVAVIAAGSLLEVTLRRSQISMPVGRVEFLYLGPMTFQETCEAYGQTVLRQKLQTMTQTKSLAVSMHEALLHLQRTYLVVGGMPEAVNVYSQTKSLAEVQDIHRSILDTYKHDFAKYGSGVDLPRLHKVMGHLPASVGEKVKYSAIDPQERSVDLRKAMDLLTLSQVMTRVHRSKASGFPLKASTDFKVFKNYFLDCGLLATQLGVGPISKEKLLQRRFINEGALAEQFAAQHLLYFYGPRHEPELFYWLREGRSGNAEVDFLVQIEDNVVPVEVKAGRSGSLKSLQQFVATKKPGIALRFDTNPLSKMTMSHIISGVTASATLLSLPLYAVEELTRLFREENE